MRPDWTTNVVDEYGFTWPSISYASLLTGDISRAQTHTSFVLNSKLPNFPFPFAVDEAGWLLRTLAAFDDIGITLDSGSGGTAGGGSGTGPGAVDVVIDPLAQSLPTGDRKIDASLQKALDHIDASFSPAL